MSIYTSIHPSYFGCWSTACDFYLFFCGVLLNVMIIFRHGSVTCRPPLTAQQEGTTSDLYKIISALSLLMSYMSQSLMVYNMCVWVNVSSSAVLSALCRVRVLMCLWMCLTFPFCLSLAHSFARCRLVCWSGAVYLAEFALISCTTGEF